MLGQNFRSMLKVSILATFCFAILMQPTQGNSKEPTDKHSETLQTMVTEAYKLYEAKRIDEALTQAKRAEAFVTQTSIPETREIVVAHNRLGMLFFNTGFSHEAKASYERALQLAKKVMPDNDVGYGDLYNNLGQVESRLGNLKAARSYLESALTVKDVRPFDLAVYMDNLGSIYSAISEFDKAEEQHVKALAIFEQEKGPIDGDVATAVGNLGSLYERKLDYANAEAYLLRALEIHARLLGLEHDETLLNLHNLAEHYLTTGNQKRADQLTNLVVSLGEGPPSMRHMNLANFNYTLAQRIFWSDLGLAERLAARAVKLFQSAAGTSASETLNAMFLLGNVYAAKGNFPGAENTYITLINNYNSTGKAKKAAESMIALGKVLQSRGKTSYPTAIEMFGNAIKTLRDQTPLDEELLASALGNLGMLYFEDDKPEIAEAKITEALNVIAQVKDSIELPWLLHNRGMLWYHLGKREQALSDYEQAKKLWGLQHGHHHPFVATTAANMALVYWMQRDTNRALNSFTEANSIREPAAQRALTIGTEWERLAYAEALQSNLYKVISFCFDVGQRDRCEGEPAGLAATIWLQRKGRVLDAIAQTMVQLRKNLRPKDRISLDQLNNVREQIAKISSPFHVSHESQEERRELEKLKKDEEDLQSVLSHESALYQAALMPVTADMVSRALPQDAVLIEFLKYWKFDPVRTGKGNAFREERYAALVLRPQGAPELFDLGAAQKIEAAVEEFRHKLRSPLSEQVELDAAQLHHLLIAPLRRLLTNSRLVLISPDGPLNLIPFGLLSDDKNRRLGDRFIVNYLYSGRELLRGNQVAESSRMVMLVANPDFNAEVAMKSETAIGRFADGNSFDALPRTHDEVEAIQSLFIDTPPPLEGKDATVEALKGIKRPLILHVATHGVFVPMEGPKPEWKTDFMFVGNGFFTMNRAVPSALENPMLYSGLVMAGANRSVQGGRYGIVTALEMAGLDLTGTALVVLSACDTGVGTNTRGGEFAGLRRALSIAGAASDVTSLWKANDEATQALMKHYYQFLLDGEGRAEALQHAQGLIKQDARWTHPYFWAAFVPSGDWRPMGDSLAQMRKARPN